MTIVGPRPERPEIAEEYEKVMPEFRLRLQAKAGLTGYAQVYGKYNTTPYDKLLMDGMSYYALAKAADVSPSTLHELMTGKTKPYLYTVYKICNALDISISDLLLEESRVPGMVSELNEKEQELVYLYRKCSNKKKEHLEIYLRMLAQYDNI